MKNIIYILFLSLISISCQKIDIVESPSGYQKNIVVYSEIVANETFTGVQFTKTLPISETYDISKAELQNVIVYLKVNGLKIIPLTYTKNGIYAPDYNISFNKGDVIELFASYNNRSVYSKTTIPLSPIIQKIKLTEKYFIEASVVPQPGVVYGALWIILGSGVYGEIASDYFQIYKQENSDSILVRTNVIPENYRSSQNVYIQINTFDGPYIDYFLTRNNNQPINNAFAQVGAPINWNVHGDGVIGLFIGETKGSLIPVKIK